MFIDLRPFITPQYPTVPFQSYENPFGSMTTWTIPCNYLSYLSGFPHKCFMFMAILQLCDILPCVTLIPDEDYAEIVTEVKNKIKLKPISLVLFPHHNCNILEQYRSGCCGLILILVYLFSKPVCIFETSSVFFLKYCGTSI